VVELSAARRPHLLLLDVKVRVIARQRPGVDCVTEASSLLGSAERVISAIERRHTR
jgi:hypothetical protein